ncbi:MAG: hypothetical protein IMY72_00240 [Bacteroidetes bacterium]|nr:hypothetical protein [Bacteroidota bacterium]
MILILRRTMLVLVYVLISHSLYSQYGVKLDKNLKIDTIRVWINYPQSFEREQVVKYDSAFERTIGRLNAETSFYIVLDSINSSNRIIMNMEPINYVGIKRNIFSTCLSLALIGGQVYLITTYGWIVPIWPILLPATYSVVNLEIDQEMIVSKPIAKTNISSGGYLINREKQTKRFERNFEKDIYKFFKKIDKQNVKNNKL